MAACENLATKQEVQALAAQIANKVDDSEKQAIIQAGGALGLGLATSKILTVEQLAQQGIQSATSAKTVAKVASQTAQGALQSSVSAAQAAKQANFEALLAKTRASSAAANAAKAGSTAGKALGLVGSIFSILGTFATIAALTALTKKVADLSKRLSDFKAEFTEYKIEQNKRYGELNFKVSNALAYTSQNRERLDKQEKQIAENRQKVNDALYQIQLNKTQIELTKKAVANANSKVDAVKVDIANTIGQVNQTLSQVSASNNDVAKTNQQITDVKTQQSQLASQLKQQLIEITIAKSQLKTLQEIQTVERIQDLIKSGIIPLTQKVNLNDKITTFDKDITTLKSGLEVNTKLTNSNISNLKSGLEVSSKLTNQQITELKTSQQTTEFKLNQTEVKLNQKIEQVANQAPKNTVNQEQYNQLNNKIDNLNNKIPNLINPYTISIAVGSLPIIQQILQKSSQVSPCQAPALVPPVAAQAKANGTATATLQAVNTAQNAAIQNTVTQNFNLLSNAQHGLAAIRNFVGTAWQAARGDKIMNALTTGLVLHNAVVLSANIGETIGDTASLALEVMGIRDENDQLIDVNNVIKVKLTQLIEKILGQENYQQLTTKLQNNIRIYQAGANLLYNVRSLVDATQDLQETTAENVSFIGNALKKDGVVRENSYDWMPTDYQHTSRILHKLDKLDNSVNTIQEIASDTKEISEELSELKTSRDVFKAEISKAYDSKDKDEQDKLENVIDTPEPSEADEDNLATDD